MIEYGALFKALMVGGAIIIGIASSYMWKPDNSLEEHAELYIYDATELDIDLTPASPEKGNYGNK